MSSKRLLQIGVAAVLGLVSSPFIPLYVEHSLTRAQVIGRAGDLISWNFRLVTLPGYIEDMQYASRDESPYLFLVLDLGLWLVYAAAVALGLFWAMRRLSRQGN